MPARTDSWAADERRSTPITRAWCGDAEDDRFTNISGRILEDSDWRDSHGGGVSFLVLSAGVVDADTADAGAGARVRRGGFAVGQESGRLRGRDPPGLPVLLKRAQNLHRRNQRGGSQEANRGDRGASRVRAAGLASTAIAGCGGTGGAGWTDPDWSGTRSRGAVAGTIANPVASWSATRIRCGITLVQDEFCLS